MRSSYLKYMLSSGELFDKSEIFDNFDIFDLFVLIGITESQEEILIKLIYI